MDASLESPESNYTFGLDQINHKMENFVNTWNIMDRFTIILSPDSFKLFFVFRIDSSNKLRKLQWFGAKRTDIFHK